MCGIAGIVALTSQGTHTLSTIQEAVHCLRQRGPDASGIATFDRLSLGHARLSIIDTSDAGRQPMSDPSGRYTIIFNGEFFNYREHREELVRRGVSLHSNSDTEVLLHWYILEGAACLQRVNGFFALAIYDRTERKLFVARDRMGVKPLLTYTDSDRFCFASEMKALVSMGIPMRLDRVSLFQYLQLNYVPGPESMLLGVRKLEPGHYQVIRNIGENASVDEPVAYYQIPDSTFETTPGYHEAQDRLLYLLERSVERRMVADVPLGAFLSGGIDSSIIVALASGMTKKLKTFSIGFRDEPQFDETHFAELVAQRYKTDHTVFKLTTDDLYSVLQPALDYIDEPFADSSALNVFLLSRETRKHVTVALSGDGADELFGGYNKHAAEWRLRNNSTATTAIRLLGPLWKQLPRSRNGKWTNRFRQLDRFSAGAGMSATDRYWRWAGFEDESSVRQLFMHDSFSTDERVYQARKTRLTRFIKGGTSLNDVLRNDMELVLVNDMLTKVDLMSMANSLEVRTPFLDYEVVNFASRLPGEYKIDGNGRKKVLRDAFRKLLPDELYRRGKQGFEVPLLNWFRGELRTHISEDMLSRERLADQGIFDPEAVALILKRLFSRDPGESVAQVWALLVFQHWYDRYRPLHDA